MNEGKKMNEELDHVLLNVLKHDTFVEIYYKDIPILFSSAIRIYEVTSSAFTVTNMIPSGEAVRLDVDII